MTPRPHAPKDLLQIAFVGGGATAVAAVRALVASADARPKRLSLLLFEDGVVGPGLAYSTVDGAHRLNMDAAHMGIEVTDPGGFDRWRRARGGDGSDPNPARAEYGDYLAAVFETVVEEARRKGISVRHIPRAVTGIQRRRGFVSLSTAQGVTAADAVAVCVGNVRTRRFDHLQPDDGAFASPYEPTVADIPRDATIVVIGTRLSAVDAVLSAAARGHHGPIVLVSRSSGLPRSQPLVRSPHDLTRFDPAWFERVRRSGRRLTRADLGDRLLLELAEAGVPLAEPVDRRPDGTGLPPLATRADDRVYEVLEAVGEVSSQAWQLVDPAERLQLVEHQMRSWVEHRHRIPARSAAIVRDLVRTGRLQVRTGFTAVERHGPGRFQVDVDDGRDQIQADAVVDATGTEYDLTLADSPLLDQMRAARLLFPDPVCGVAVHPTTHQLLDAAGRPWPDLWFIGPLSRGVHFYTNSIHTLRRHAAEAAPHILRVRPHVAVASDALGHHVAEGA